MSAADVLAHQAKHGFIVPALTTTEPLATKEPKPRMNKTEAEYGRIIEAQKQRGEVHEFRFEGISLSWGADPESGKPMWYTPDFYVRMRTEIDPRSGWVVPTDRVRLIEIKGGHIYEKDLIRFKGCRAEWPQFSFELHQKKAGEWRRLL